MTISELKEKIDNVRAATPWETVEVNAIYHIPPLVSLKRREVLILTKNHNSATYKRVGDKEQVERTMFKTSVFAKFLIKRKKY